MVNYILIIPLLISFFGCLFLLPPWIKRAKASGLSGKDIHKKDQRQVAEAGGIPVIAGFVLGVLAYIAIQTFVFQIENKVVEIFAIITVILITALIGVIDDLLTWKVGLSNKLRLFLTFFAAIPLMIIDSADSVIRFPFLGVVDTGILYALAIVPVAVVGASTTFNFLAGFNGLEARQGILMLTALAVATWFTGSAWLTVITICMIVALLAFLLFNSNPARVFPGDITTYSIGAMLASIAILGDLERFALFIFTPNIIEVFLKVRGNIKLRAWKAESFGVLNKGGTLEPRYKESYSLTHVAIKLLKKYKGKATESAVVNLINIFQIIVIGIVFYVYREGIFG